MRKVSYYGSVSFEIRGEREDEAASSLREALTGVAKRKSGYIESEVEAILEDIRHDYGVEITLVTER